MKTLVLGNTNLAPLRDVMRELDLEFGDYGDYRLQLHDRGARAHASDVERLLLILDGDLLFAEGQDPAELVGEIAAFADAHPTKQVLVTTWSVDPASPRSYAEIWAEEGSPLEWQARGRAELVEAARQRANLLVLDMDLVVSALGRERLLAPNFWYLGRIRYSQIGFERIGSHLRQLLRAARYESRKVLVLDLDGTLWGGTLGEEGFGGIRLSEDGEGRVYRDLQQAILSLRQTGVLLALSSKNDREAVEEVFEKHPMMRLRLEDFAALRVDWREKDEHLREIAAELGLGLDSLVFLDDSPRERAWIEARLPEVAVPPFPERLEELPHWFRDQVAMGHFPRYRLTSEDRMRPKRYAARRSRLREEALLGRESFLQSLEIRIDTDLDPSRHVERAAQLTQRTNQFNLTARRYSAEEISLRARDPGWKVILARYEDRFGAEGIVGVALVDLRSGEIDSLLASCRVLGRGVEQALLGRAEDSVREAGHQRCVASFRPSGRNQRAREFLPSAGYRVLETRAGGEIRYERSLGQGVAEESRHP